MEGDVSDPSTPPAQYTKSLIIDCLQAVTDADADAEAGGWVRGFSRAVRLEVGSQGVDTIESAISLLPFHGFSPFIKSLHVSFCAVPSSQVFGLILSFPLLEDPNVFGHNSPIDNSDGVSAIVQTSSPPMTGSLRLFRLGGIGSVARWLSSVPGGIHFRKLALKWCIEEDLLLTTALVERGSHALESLEIGCEILGTHVRYLHPHR